MVEVKSSQDLELLSELIKKYALHEVVVRKGVSNTTNNITNNATNKIDLEITLKALDGEIIKENGNSSSEEKAGE